MQIVPFIVSVNKVALSHSKLASADKPLTNYAPRDKIEGTLGILRSLLYRKTLSW